MVSFVRVAAGAVLLGVLAVTGCGTPRQTVDVVERPETVEAEGGGSADSVVRATVPVPSGYDTVQARRFDQGKMWPIHDLPTEYLETTYEVTLDEAWRTKVMRASLRFGSGCSASFVSADGLVMTNHHCAREYVTAVSRGEENLLEEGFQAGTIDRERPVPELFVDQLVEVENVTQRVTRELPDGGDTRDVQRQRRVSSLEDQMTAAAREEDERLRVDIVSFYQGARYAAYTYRRHTDVRLVMVPEQALGYFGGETDNFTYPRHALDVAFFRVYAEDGTPLEPENHFRVDPGGAQEGDAVFAVGNPGSTSRLDMVSQLQYERDHRLPNRLDVLRSRSQLLRTYIADHPETATTYGLRNTLFSVQNSIKGLEGQLRGLRDPYLMARRGTAVRTLLDTAQAVDSLQAYSRAVREIRRLQQSKRVLAEKEGAFTTFTNLTLGSRVLTRAIHGYYYDFLRTRGADPERVQDIRDDAEEIVDWPAELERAFLEAQLREIRSAYGADHPALQRIFRTRPPDSLAAHLVQNSALMDSSRFRTLLDEGYLKSDDPSVRVIEALGPLFLNLSRQMEDLRQSEETLNRRLSRVRRAVYGATIAPDATFSLRVSDGVVKGYQVDETPVPAFTTFHGLYDKYRTHEGGDWALPDRWVSPPDSFDRDTPLNLVSTNDISGGSSGSPLLNRDLEVVGVVFDSNMEALPNEYVYRTADARAIAVDVRGILEALRVMYGAPRLVDELTEGRRATEAPEASASSRRR